MVNTHTDITKLHFIHGINFYFRTEGRNTIKIRLIDREEKLSFMCYSKDEKKKTSIEIHQADCMCEATNQQHVTSSTYTPLDVLNEVENNNQSNSNNEYLDVV